MTSYQTEATVIIRDLLDNNWDKSNTDNIKPEITTGWWNETRFDNMVTVTAMDENVADGGQTGYFGMVSGSTGARLMVGTLQVDCWSDADQFSGSTNAKDVVYNFSEEVDRIITNNTLDTSELRFVSFIGRTSNPGLDESPVIERQSCDLRYSYYRLP
jgi:hypothetical protein